MNMAIWNLPPAIKLPQPPRGGGDLSVPLLEFLAKGERPPPLRGGWGSAMKTNSIFHFLSCTYKPNNNEKRKKKYK